MQTDAMPAHVSFLSLKTFIRVINGILTQGTLDKAFSGAFKCISCVSSAESTETSAEH